MPAARMNSCCPIVILAGGQGERIGGDKAHRLLAGRSLLDHAVATAAGYSATVAISVKGADARVPGNVHQLQDAAGVHGPIAGLASALRFARDLAASHVMIMPCDTPFLPDDLFRRLRDGIGLSAAAIAQYDGRMHPACSLWRADAGEHLPGYLELGGASLIGFAKTVGWIGVEWRTTRTDPFFNINTVDDLARAEEIFAQR